MLHQLLHGDCLEVMKSLASNSIDLIVCDPPYGVTDAVWDNKIPVEQMFSEYRRILKEKGTILLFCSEPLASEYIYKNKDLYKYTYIWIKNFSANFMQAKNMPLRNYEMILCFSKGAVGHASLLNNRMFYNPQGVEECNKFISRKNNNKWGEKGDQKIYKNRKSLQKDYIRDQTNYPKMVLFYDCVNNNKRLNSTQKPVSLLEHLIKTHCADKSLVLDNCCGSASTAIACINTDRDFIMIEKDINQYQQAKARIESRLAGINDKY